MFLQGLLLFLFSLLFVVLSASSTVLGRDYLDNSYLPTTDNQHRRVYRDAATNRDPQYILDMIETLLTTVESRFKKMDVTDATHRFTLQNILRKMDSLDQKVSDTGNNVAALLATMKTLEARFTAADKTPSGTKTHQTPIPTPTTNKGSTINIETRLQALDSKVDSVSRGISQIKNGMNHNHHNRTAIEDQLLQQGSERRHIVTTPDGKFLQESASSTSANNARLQNELESMKGTLRGMDAKLQTQADKMTATITDLVQTVADIREAVLEPSPDAVIASQIQTGNSSTNVSVDDVNEKATSKPVKFERFGRKLRPLMHVAEKLDDIYTAVVNTRHSIDDTRRKSEQLLSHSYHTSQALTDVKYDIFYQTTKIIENLGQVEQWLRDQQTGAESSLDPKFLHSGLKELLDKVDEDEKERITQKLPEFVDRVNSPDEAEHPGSDEFHSPPIFKPTQPSPSAPIEIVSVSSEPFLNFTPHMNATRLFNMSYAAKACPFQEYPGINCADLKTRGVNKSGVYYILIKGTTYWFMKVYCEMETAEGGWTVIQRRDEYGEPHESFNRDWNEYKNGFGDLTKEFWLGNENIFMLTNQDEYTLRIDLEDFDGNKRYAEYSKFKMSTEAENYKLEIGGYDGTAGDSLNDPWYGSNLSPFSTYNRDNDRSSLNCASMLRGGWWWRSCGRGLNGLYLTDPNDLAARQGIVWFRWRGWDYTLKKAQMMIRPKDFEPNAQPITPESQDTVSTSNSSSNSSEDEVTTVTTQQETLSTRPL